MNGRPSPAARYRTFSCSTIRDIGSRTGTFSPLRTPEGRWQESLRLADKLAAATLRVHAASDSIGHRLQRPLRAHTILCHRHCDPRSEKAPVPLIVRWADHEHLVRPILRPLPAPWLPASRSWSCPIKPDSLLLTVEFTPSHISHQQISDRGGPLGPRARPVP